MDQEIFEGSQVRTEQIRELLNPIRNGAGTLAYLNVIDAVRGCLVLRDYLRSSFQVCLARAFANRINDYQFDGKLYLLCIETALTTYEAVGKKVAELRSRPLPDQSQPDFPESRQAAERFEHYARDFEQAVSDVRSLKTDFTATWPWINTGLLEKSLAEEGRGTRRSVKDAFDEIRHRARAAGD